MPPPRPTKKRKRERATERSTQLDDDDDTQRDDTAPLSPPSRPRTAGGNSDTAAVAAAQPVPVPVSQLQLSSLAGEQQSASASSSSASSLSAPSAGRGSAKLVVVLVKAGLETIRTKKGHELVTADTHASLLLRLKKEPSEYRPDIVHQCLLTLLDSPLNKAGLLQVLVQTDSNALIQVNPATRIPRTFKRFAGLMGQPRITIRQQPSALMHAQRTTIAAADCGASAWCEQSSCCTS